MGALRKTFLSNLLLLIGINLLIKPFYLLVIEAGVQERLGPDAYGMYFALLNISFILNILPDLGITNWNNRHVASEGVVHASQLGKLLRIRSLLALIYLFACTCIGLYMHYDGYEVAWLIILGFNQVLSTGVLFLRSYLTGVHAFASDRFVSILDRLLLIGMLGAALMLIPRDEVFPLSYLIYSQTIAYGATFLITLLLVFRLRSTEITGAPLSTDNVLSASFPFALLILFSMISGRIDAVMLERMQGSYDAGIYAMAFRLGDMLTMISYLFAVLLLPLFSRQLARNEEPRELFGIAFRLLVAGCTWIFLVSYFESKSILDLLFHEYTMEASHVLPWTIGSAAMFSLQYATGTLLTAGNKMKIMIVTALISLGINLYMNAMLIPLRGAVGAAQTAFITQSFVFLVQCFFIQKYYHVWTMGLIGRSILFFALSFTAAYLLAMKDISAGSSILLITAIVAILGVLIKMIPFRDIQKILPISASSQQEEI
jgi:O-antigen/teichoic acid export membrane protein